MPIGCLITIEPLDTSTGNRVTIYTTSVNDRRVTGLNGNLWEPAVVQVPSLTMNLWNGDFQAAPDPGSAAFSINMQVVKQSFPSADQYAWIGAPVKIWAEEIGTAWPWTQRFLGRVASINRRDQRLGITAKVETETFDKNVLTATYAGTGGIEGGADIKGQVKPLVIGWAQNVEPVLIDSVNSVYQFSAYGAIEAVSTLYERASDFGASIGDFATYAALVAATIPAGRWATCLASGLIRLGAPAYGVITGDVRGYRVGATTPRLTGAIINALATISGVSTSNLNTASLTALDTAVPYNANLVLTEQTRFMDIAAKMALACNYQAAISLVGQFFVSSINLGASASLTINAQGRASPQVITPPDELEVSVPYWKVILGANRAWRVHTLEEIALTAPWVERGLYSGATTYREGNVVSLSDGSRYVYINATASAGNTPPNASFWTLLSDSPTVAGIIGQGDLATTNRRALPFGSNLLVNSEMALTDPTYGGGLIPVGFQAGWTGNSTNLGAVTFNDRRVSLKDGTFAFARDLTGAPNGTGVDCISSYPTGGWPLYRSAVPVLPGETIVASALIGHQNCLNANLIIGFYDENGAYVDEYAGTSVAGNIAAAAYNTLTRANLFAVTNTVTVPADGTGGGTGKRRFAVVWTRFYISGSPTNPRLITAAPLLAKVPSGQTAIPAYAPGPSDRQASYGAVLGNNVVSPTYGVQGDAELRTALGTAAGVVGQTAWATYTGYTPSQVTNPGANVLFNSSFNIGTLGWQTGSWVGPLKAAGDVGAWYMSTNVNGQNLYTADVTKNPVFPNLAYTFQVYVAVNGTSSGTNRPYIYIDWHNSSGAFISSSAVTYLTVGASYDTYSVTATSPATAAYARVVIASNQVNTGGGAMYVSKTKLELGGARTPWSDEATNGALYQSGQTIDSLKPAQANADVTGANIASGIVGQGAGATANTLAGLDPTAAATLSALAVGSSQAATFGSVIQKFLVAGASATFNGRAAVIAGGSASGTMRCQLRAAPSGSGSWVQFALGSGASVAPTEPGFDTAAGTFTNTTGVDQVFDFAVNVTRTPSTAGGAVEIPKTFIAI